MRKRSAKPEALDMSMAPPVTEGTSPPEYVNGVIPPQMREIAPDYTKWRKKPLCVNLALAIVIFALEAALLIVSGAKGTLLTGRRAGMQIWECVWHFLVFPTLVNFSLIGLEAYIMKKSPRHRPHTEQHGNADHDGHLHRCRVHTLRF